MSCVPDASRGVLATSAPGEMTSPFVDFEVSPFGHVVEVEDLAVVGIFDHDLRMQVALVLDDDEARLAARILFAAHRFAFDQILVANLAARLGQNRDTVRIPLAEDVSPGFDRPDLLRPEITAPVGISYFSSSRPFSSTRAISPLRVSTTCWPASLRHDLQAGELDDTALLGLDVAVFDVALADATDVERTHRELRARFADTLGGDDADRHAFFDHRTGRQVHAVAAAADAQRGVAGHRAADLDLLQAQLLDLAGDFRGDQLVLGDDHFVGDRIDDVRPADAAADRVGQAHFDLLAAVDDPLGDALGRAAIVAS